MSSALVASTPSTGTDEAAAASTMKNVPSSEMDFVVDGEGSAAMNGGSSNETNERHVPQHDGMLGSSSPVNGDGAGATHASSATKMGDFTRESFKRAECTAERSGLLPAELRRILNEIATTGMCPWLPWSRTAPRDQARPPGTAHASSAASQASEASAVSHLSGFMRENRTSLSAWTSSGTRQNPQLVSALQQHAATLNQQHHTHLHHRRFPSSSSPSPTASGPPRKKQRNGLFGALMNRSFGAGKGKSRKRSLGQGWNSGGSATTTITTTVVPPSSGMFSPGSSVGGMASGSDDPEDASQSYDSESTSASDVSGWRAGQSTNPPLHYHQLLASRNDPESSAYGSQCDAFREAAEIVLDHFYQSKGGYTLSPAERAKTQRLSAGKGSSEDVYLQRRKRILAAFEVQTPDMAPPYTIQRVAEVLMAPERYYSQTHKLCNALEKLVLVTSSTQAFGGYTGGITAQSLREDQELSALAEEKRRIQLELRRRRLRNSSIHSALDEQSGGSSSFVHPSGSEAMDVQATGQAGSDAESPGEDTYASSGSASPEMMEAAARASLRSKFDHVGMETGMNRGDGRPGSPPPPALSISASAASAYVLPGHGGYSPPGLARTQSPTYMNAGGEGGLPSPPLSSMHHGPTSPSLDLASLQRHPTSPTERTLSTAALAAIPSSSSSSFLASVMMMMPSKEVDVESRSSASSDVDSESDVSFDDSASDRSDGSDLDFGSAAAAAAAAASAASVSAPGSTVEPFTSTTAASSSRAAAAFGRIQLHQQQLAQHQRLMQSRLLGTSPTPSAALPAAASQTLASSLAAGGASALAASPPKDPTPSLVSPRTSTTVAGAKGGPSSDPSGANRAEGIGRGGRGGGIGGGIGDSNSMGHETEIS